MRTKIALPKEFHEKIKKLSLKINIPVGTLISLMVTDTLLNRNLTPNKEYLTKISKTTIDINVSFEDNFYYDTIANFIEKTKGYSVRELVIYCIFEELQQFDGFLDAKNLEYAKKLRINNVDKNHSNIHYTKETLERNKATPPIDTYINKKSEYFGIGVASLKKFYVAKEVNRIIEKYEKEFDIFCEPEKYE